MRRGFTLLEMLVATFIMGVAIVGLLSNISTSLNHASRVTEYDRAALLARHKMDELLIAPALPAGQQLEGTFPPALTGGVECGWRAVTTSFEAPIPVPGAPFVERVELEVWWKLGGRRRAVTLEGFRRGVQLPGVQPQ